jgi:hypothetical protein
MIRERPHLASPDDVKMTRNESEVIIAYADERIEPMRIPLNDELRRMSDHEILEWWTENARGRAEQAAAYEHVAVEIPPGRPQIAYKAWGSQWTPRGGVLRCAIEGGSPDGSPIIRIDEHALSWEEFGRMLLTYEGWGMRIVFVPEDETHEPPRIVVREPSESAE